MMAQLEIQGLLSILHEDTTSESDTGKFEEGVESNKDLNMA